MRIQMGILVLLLLGAGMIGLWTASAALAPAARADEAADAPGAAALQRPAWKVGDTWVIETVTQRIQGREAQSACEPPRIQWQFKVAAEEKTGGHDCYRIEIQCLTKGRMQPKATIWCDKSTLLLRQFQTQLAVEGRYRTIQESYDVPQGQFAPVVASINALPLGLPAFLPKGSKATDTFRYTSQPLPAGSKDPGILRFSHTMKQEVLPAGAKSLEQVPRAYAKDLERKPITEVRLSDQQQSLTQLWQQGAPWPVYAENGRTQAWLVTPQRP